MLCPSAYSVPPPAVSACMLSSSYAIHPHAVLILLLYPPACSPSPAVSTCLQSSSCCPRTVSAAAQRHPGRQGLGVPDVARSKVGVKGAPHTAGVASRNSLSPSSSCIRPERCCFVASPLYRERLFYLPLKGWLYLNGRIAGPRRRRNILWLLRMHFFLPYARSLAIFPLPCTRAIAVFGLRCHATPTVDTSLPPPRPLTTHTSRTHTLLVCLSSVAPRSYPSPVLLLFSKATFIFICMSFLYFSFFPSLSSSLVLPSPFLGRLQWMRRGS